MCESDLDLADDFISSMMVVPRFAAAADGGLCDPGPVVATLLFSELLSHIDRKLGPVYKQH